MSRSPWSRNGNVGNTDLSTNVTDHSVIEEPPLACPAVLLIHVAPLRVSPLDLWVDAGDLLRDLDMSGVAKYDAGESEKP